MKLLCEIKLIIFNSFCFSWQPESKFPFSQVRLPPKDGPKPEFQVGQEIEVFSRLNEQEVLGWWRAVIKVTDFLMILIRSQIICSLTTFLINCYLKFTDDQRRFSSGRIFRMGVSIY